MQFVVFVWISIFALPAAAAERSLFDGETDAAVPIQFAPRTDFGHAPTAAADERDLDDGPIQSLEEYTQQIKNSGCGVILLHFEDDDATVVVRRAKGRPADEEHYVWAYFKVFRGEERKQLLSLLRRSGHSNHSNEASVEGSLVTDTRLDPHIAAAAQTCENLTPKQ